MEKLKILEAMDCYLPDVDGVVNCMHNYCTNLKNWSDLTVMVPKNKKGYVDKFPYKIHRCNSFKVPIIRCYYGVPKSDKKFKKIVENKKYDIVHIHSPFNMASYACRVAKKQNIPFVATYHTNMLQIFEDVFKIKWVAKLAGNYLARLYNNCDEIFVCSPLVEQQARNLGCKSKITYLPFGTEIPRCENVEENRTLANKKFDLDENKLVFVYVGRVMKLKRIDFILDSLKIVKDKGIDFKFFVVGKGAELEKLQRHTKKLGLEDRVVFTGFLPREDFPLILSRADLLLFPSIYDNFGLVKVECAAFKTPGVFIENSCAGFDVKDGHNGFLSKNTVIDFSNVILDAISDRQRLAQIGQNAYDELYISWEDCTKQLHTRLQEIVEEKKKI